MRYNILIYLGHGLSMIETEVEESKGILCWRIEWKLRLKNKCGDVMENDMWWVCVSKWDLGDLAVCKLRTRVFDPNYLGKRLKYLYDISKF